VKIFKDRAGVPSGVIKGIMPSATMSQNISSSGGNNTSGTLDSEAEEDRSDMGDLKIFDEDGAEIVERKRTKYHVSDKVNIGDQV
jgi:hypothetical protein